MSIFDELASDAAVEFHEGRMLPLEAYRSDEVLAAEREAIFASAWTCVARVADLPRPGDHLTAEVPSGDPGADREAHRSIIVVRDAGGPPGGARQRVRPPWRPAARGLWQRGTHHLPVPRVGVPARRHADRRALHGGARCDQRAAAPL
ncbi:MAG: hypothetical protein V9G12_19495 [Microthrixaceae bacterium]